MCTKTLKLVVSLKPQVNDSEYVNDNYIKSKGI